MDFSFAYDLLQSTSENVLLQRIMSVTSTSAESDDQVAISNAAGGQGESAEGGASSAAQPASVGRLRGG